MIAKLVKKGLEKICGYDQIAGLLKRISKLEKLVEAQAEKIKTLEEKQ